MKTILSFFDFCTVFSFIFALTFHKCQMVKKACLFIFYFLAFFKSGARCSFFRRALCVRFCLCFLFFSGFSWVPFWLWVLGAALLLFPSGFSCAFLFFSFFMKTILPFLSF